MLRETDVIQKADEVAGETRHHPQNRKLRDVTLVVATVAGVLSSRTANSGSRVPGDLLGLLSRTLARPPAGSVERLEDAPPCLGWPFSPSWPAGGADSPPGQVPNVG